MPSLAQSLAPRRASRPAEAGRLRSRHNLPATSATSDSQNSATRRMARTAVRRVGMLALLQMLAWPAAGEPRVVDEKFVKPTDRIAG